MLFGAQARADRVDGGAVTDGDHEAGAHEDVDLAELDLVRRWL